MKFTNNIHNLSTSKFNLPINEDIISTLSTPSFLSSLKVVKGGRTSPTGYPANAANALE